MFKRKTNKNEMVRTVFENTVEKKFSPVRKFYAILTVDGAEKLTTYESISRTDAKEQFEFEAKSLHGSFDGKVYSFN
ncbi:hypothetical protein [Cytobacillus gottheilii]|uniref:hypothetical protein n=1 Tax=Cytobacillus gottheilii TaxID=859144 RepID=UPI0009B95E34|nr:hypothetical protein [Cytobacillus gottheilii]